MTRLAESAQYCGFSLLLWLSCVGSVTGEPNAAESNTEKRMYTGSMGSECVSLLGCFPFGLGLGLDLATTPAFASASVLALVAALTCVVPGACVSKIRFVVLCYMPLSAKHGNGKPAISALGRQ